MEQLADRYAKLRGATVLSSRIEDNSITFVLSIGPKLTMSTRQLEDAIAELEEKQKAVTETESKEPAQTRLATAETPIPYTEKEVKDLRSRKEKKK